MDTNINKFNVALIDSMINPSAFSQNIHTFTVTDNSKVIEYNHNIPSYSWLHGTICAKILLDLSPTLNLICINVFDENNHISFEHLKTAIEFAYNHDCKLVSELVKAIKHIYQGETYIQPDLIPALNSRLIHRDEDQEKIDALTRRELEVLKLVAKGHFNKEIAIQLDISERTVKNHISSIFRKIDVSDRTQAAVFAIKNNLIKI